MDEPSGIGGPARCGTERIPHRETRIFTHAPNSGVVSNRVVTLESRIYRAKLSILVQHSHYGIVVNCQTNATFTVLIQQQEFRFDYPLWFLGMI